MKGVPYRRTPSPNALGYYPDSPEYDKAGCLDELRRLAAENRDIDITQDFFAYKSSIPIDDIFRQFGTWAQFVSESGLRPSRYQRTIANKVAAQSSTDHLNLLNESRFNYANKYFSDTSIKKKWVKMIGAADLHDVEIDPFYLRTLLHAIKAMDPDIICLGGDVFDFFELSRFDKDIRDWKPVERIRFGREEILAPIRRAAPRAVIDLLEGNHEARLVRHMAACSPQLREILSGVQGINDVGKLLKLDEFEINYISKTNLCQFPTQTKALEKAIVSENYKDYFGCFLVHHHTDGKNYKKPGFNGHNHKHVVDTMFNPDYGGGYEWHQVGCGHRRIASYAEAKKWNNGFLMVHINTENRHSDFHYVTVHDTFSVVAGEKLERLPEEYFVGIATAPPPASTADIDVKEGDKVLLKGIPGHEGVYVAGKPRAIEPRKGKSIQKGPPSRKKGTTRKAKR